MTSAAGASANFAANALPSGSYCPTHSSAFALIGPGFFSFSTSFFASASDWLFCSAFAFFCRGSWQATSSMGETTLPAATAASTFLSSSSHCPPQISFSASNEAAWPVYSWPLSSSISSHTLQFCVRLSSRNPRPRPRAAALRRAGLGSVLAMLTT